MKEDLSKKVFTINSDKEFLSTALDLFRYQSAENFVYAEYLKALGKEGLRPGSIDEIPFLPVSFFRTRKVIAGEKHPTVVFVSSGTEGNIPSKQNPW